MELMTSGRGSFDVQKWGIVALVFIFGGILVAMSGKMWDVKWLLFTGLIFAFTGMFGIAAFGLMQQGGRRQRPRPTVKPVQQRPEMLKADTTNKLPPIGEDAAIPSVVDDTTELLNIPRSDKIE